MEEKARKKMLSKVVLETNKSYILIDGEKVQNKQHHPEIVQGKISFFLLVHGFYCTE